MGTSGQRSLKSKSFIKQTPPKVGFLIKIQFRNFQKPKIKLKKDPLKFQKIKNIYKEASNQKVYKTDPPKVRILIQNSISKKTPLCSKKLKIYIRRPQIKSFNFLEL